MEKEIQREGFRVVETHPASTPKASETPVKAGKESIDFCRCVWGGNLETCRVTLFEIDVVAVALIRHLYLEGIRIGMRE
jgi:predicted nuclease with RNAse H fold